MPKKMKIMVIEDNASHMQLVSLAMSETGAPVDIVKITDGEMALNYLNRTGKFETLKGTSLPDLIMLDTRLPKMNGYELLAEIKKDKDLIKIPVVVFTSTDLDKDILRIYRGKANSCIVKPLEYTTLVKVINDVIVYWRDWNHSPEM